MLAKIDALIAKRSRKKKGDDSEAPGEGVDEAAAQDEAVEELQAS